MRNTSNFGWPVPTLGDEANIEKVSEAFDSVDSEVHKNRNMIGDAFSQEEAYEVGEVVVYLGATYEFIAPKSAGNWDATKVVPKSLGEIIFEKNGMPPITAEADGNPIELTDAANAPMVKCVTEIQGSQDLHGYDKPWVGGAGKNKAEPSYSSNTVGLTVNSVEDNDGNHLYYSVSGTSTGTSGTIMYSFPVSASEVVYRLTKYDWDSRISQLIWDGTAGSSITVIDNTITVPANHAVHFAIVVGVGLVLTNVKIQINVVLSTETASTFEPYSNICPITAYTEGEIEVRGKNLFGFNKTFTDKTAEYRYQSTQRLNIVGNSDNSITCAFNGGTWSFGYLEFSGIDGTRDYAISYKVKDNNTSFTPSMGKGMESDSTKLVIVVNGGNGNVSTTSDKHFTLYDIQIEVGTTESDYVPFVAYDTHTTTYPSAIYRGSEDVVNGSATGNWIVVDMGDINFTYRSEYGYSLFSSDNIPDKAQNFHFICENYNVVEKDRTSLLNGEMGCWNTVNSMNNFSVRDDRFTSVQDFMQAVAGVKIAYELATPTTSSVTPTNLPIKSLSGYNHIESSTGDMEIEYYTQDWQKIIDLIENTKELPPAPTTDGTYTLQVEVSSGTPTYSWQSTT